MENTNEVVAVAETVAANGEVKKVAVKRIAPVKKSEKKPAEKTAEKKPAKKSAEKKTAEKKAKKPTEKKTATPKEKAVSLREELEGAVKDIKPAKSLVVHLYSVDDVVADKDRDISIEARQKNPFAISTVRWGECRNMAVAYSPVPISASDKSRRGSIWELTFTRKGATVIMGDTLYSVADGLLKDIEHGYRREAGWDLKNVVTLPRDKAVALLNKLNVAYAKLAAQQAQ